MATDDTGFDLDEWLAQFTTENPPEEVLALIDAYEGLKRRNQLLADENEELRKSVESERIVKLEEQIEELFDIVFDRSKKLQELRDRYSRQEADRAASALRNRLEDPRSPTASRMLKDIEKKGDQIARDRDAQELGA